MRVLFAGTPEIAVPTLVAITESVHSVVGVLSAPDKAVGRGRRTEFPPVKHAAVAHGLTVLQPENLGEETRVRISDLSPEVLVAFAYGKIFGAKFLALFASGAINVHPSLLPRHRGPSPIPAVILAGDPVTGVTIQRMALEVDSGDILSQREIALDGTETTSVLSERLGQIGAQMVVNVLDAIAHGDDVGATQDHNAASYTSLVSKEDGMIDWSCSAEKIERSVRAYQPWPLAHTVFREQRLNLLRCSVVITENEAGADGAQVAPGSVVRVDKRQGVLVQTGNGLLAVQKLQLQSRKALEWKDFLNGVHDFVGSVLGG